MERKKRSKLAKHLCFELRLKSLPCVFTVWSFKLCMMMMITSWTSPVWVNLPTLKVTLRTSVKKWLKLIKLSSSEWWLIDGHRLKCLLLLLSLGIRWCRLWILKSNRRKYCRCSSNMLLMLITATDFKKKKKKKKVLVIETSTSSGIILVIKKNFNIVNVVAFACKKQAVNSVIVNPCTSCSLVHCQTGMPCFVCFSGLLVCCCFCFFT